MPSGEAATQLLKNAPTCDPNDTWRKSCSEDFGPPLIGSYGYVRSVPSFALQEDWDQLLRGKKNPTLLASIYYADRVPDAFKGDVPVLAGCTDNCYMPDHVLRLRLDGSVRYEQQYMDPPTYPGGGYLLTWSSLFIEDHPNGTLRD